MGCTQNLILVTGASGYIGSHVVQQTLEAGYLVRATARSARVDSLKAKFDGRVEVVLLNDLANGDYTDALKGVNAIVHLASALPWTAVGEEFLEGTIKGTMNILDQALASGVQRAVITSTFGTVADGEGDKRLASDKVYSDDEWNPGTREELLEGHRSQFYNYGIAKTLLERELWKFADVHPEMDITTINPAFVYGPFVSGSVFPKGDIASLSTVGTRLYKNILPDDPAPHPVVTPGSWDIFTLSVDVRDVAQAHILALQAPPSAEVSRKRILLSGPEYSWFDVVKYLYDTRPELRPRLPRLDDRGERTRTATADNSRARDVLGLHQFIDWKTMVDDSVNLLLEVEKAWSKQD